MTPLMSPEIVQYRLELLLRNPLTLLSSGAPVWDPLPDLKGTAAHQRLFVEYERQVVAMTVVALKWWDGTVAAQLTPGSTEKEARRASLQRRPAGPASYSGMVAVIREYWLACNKLNQEIEEDQRVPPWTFLLKWLQAANHDDAVGVLVCMPYWPIGLDEDGNWV
jgi:hypothetical protein